MSRIRRLPACVLASAALLIAPLAVAAPPIQKPSSKPAPTPDETEPAPAPEEAEPAPAPAPDEAAPPETTAPEETAQPEATPPEPEPEVAPPEPEPAPEPEPELPAWDAELPSYTDTPAPVAPDHPAISTIYVPPDGQAGTVAGAMLLGGGATLVLTSAVLLNADRDVPVWIAGATLGTIAVAIGAGVMASGLKKRRSYRQWAEPLDPPPQGNGMIAAGALAVSAGPLAMVLGGISLARQDDDDLPYGEVLLSLGAASVVTGVALIVVGARRKQQFQAWELRMSPSLSLLPGRGPGLAPAGASLGLAGRF